MINNKITNMRGIVAALLLLWTGVANGEDGPGVALGVQLGGHGFTNVSGLCSASRCTYDRAAPTVAPYLRLELSPQQAVMVAYRHGGSQEVTQERLTSAPSSIIDGSNTLILVKEVGSFSVSTTSLAYEHRLPLGMPDWEAFLKVGYHNSKFNVPQANDSASFSGILFGGGFVLNELFVAGYEYFDADDLEHGHYLYLGVEFGL